VLKENFHSASHIQVRIQLLYLFVLSLLHYLTWNILGKVLLLKQWIQLVILFFSFLFYLFVFISFLTNKFI